MKHIHTKFFTSYKLRPLPDSLSCIFFFSGSPDSLSLSLSDLSHTHFTCILVHVHPGFSIDLNFSTSWPVKEKQQKLEMWANAQRDGHPAEYRWRPLFNTAVWLTPTNRVRCSNDAKTRNPLKFAGVPQTNETISATSGSNFTIL